MIVELGDEDIDGRPERRRAGEAVGAAGAEKVFRQTAGGARADQAQLRSPDFNPLRLPSTITTVPDAVELGGHERNETVRIHPFGLA